MRLILSFMNLLTSRFLVLALAFSLITPVVALAAPFSADAPASYTTEPSAAPEAPTIENGSVVATTGVTDCSLEQVGQEARISCTFINEQGTQADIHYAVSLVMLEGETRITVDQHVYDDTFFVSAGTPVTKDMSYALPGYVEGKGELWVTAATGEGVLLATNYVGEVTLTSSPGYAEIDASSCYLIVDDEGIEYTLSQGVDIASDEVLTGYCDIKNSGSESLNLQPTLTTHYRSVFGAIVETAVPQLSVFSLQSRKHMMRSFVLRTVQGTRSQMPSPSTTCFVARAQRCRISSSIRTTTRKVIRPTLPPHGLDLRIAFLLGAPRAPMSARQ